MGINIFINMIKINNIINVLELTFNGKEFIYVTCNAKSKPFYGVRRW